MRRVMAAVLITIVSLAAIFYGVVRTRNVPTPTSASSVRALDHFDNVGGWSPHPSDGVRLELLRTNGVSGSGMKMSFDFQGKAGYAIARKNFTLGELPPNWNFSFRARGDMLPNTIEFKLLDKSGDNVWWYTMPEYRATTDWSTISVRQRQVHFAWGPIGGGPPRDIASIEVVITAGQGGKGSLSIDDLTFAELPLDVPATAFASAIATGTTSNSSAQFAIDKDSSSAWKTVITNGAHPGGDAAALTLDFGGVRTYGGIVVDWGNRQQAESIAADTSNDGVKWVVAGALNGVRGVRSYLPIADGSSRYLRLRMLSAAASNIHDTISVRSVSVLPLDFSSTPTALLHSVARDAPRAQFPRSMHDEGVYWSVIGVSGGRSETLLSEDGQLEIAKRGPTLEPFLTLNNKFAGWSDATITQSLLDSIRPIPTVKWRTPNATLAITAFAAGTAENSTTYARYRVRNTSSAKLSGTFWLALRPLQVNPPWQFLNTPGGAARVDSVSWNGSALRVNDALEVKPLTNGFRVGTSTFDAGEITSRIAIGDFPAEPKSIDARSLASASFAWPIDLLPGDSTEFAVAIPLDGAGEKSKLVAAEVATTRNVIAERLLSVSAVWAHDQDAVRIHLPALAPPIATAIKANLAWILINRDGPGIQPGSRSYERSWIRDGSLTAEALLRLGRIDEAKAFAEWYAKYQYPSGKIPCCVDGRGADPVDEHDSHGEFIHLVYEVWRYSGDKKFAENMWPRVKLAAQFLDSLRHTHLTPEYQQGALLPYRGMLPPSISHEGYSAKPMHSYWDDGFALLGFKNATALASALGHSDDAKRIGGWRDEFENDLLNSLARAMQLHHINYLPGSVELGDFDATSTTTLIAPVGELAKLPRAAVDSTFARYYRSSSRRTRPDSVWDNYTPYEWRTVGTLLRLNKKEEALTLLNQFMGDRRPIAWQQWAEVVWQNARTPKFIGDMPHTWVGSDFIRSALDLFAYDNESDSTLVVGAGISGRWLQNGDSIAVHGLRTLSGTIGFTMRANNSSVTVQFDTDIQPPPGGIRVISPRAQKISSVKADGAPVPISDDNSVILHGAPHTIVFTYR